MIIHLFWNSPGHLGSWKHFIYFYKRKGIKKLYQKEIFLFFCKGGNIPFHKGRQNILVRTMGTGRLLQGQQGALFHWGTTQVRCWGSSADSCDVHTNEHLWCNETFNTKKWRRRWFTIGQFDMRTLEQVVISAQLTIKSLTDTQHVILMWWTTPQWCSGIFEPPSIQTFIVQFKPQVNNRHQERW